MTNYIYFTDSGIVGMGRSYEEDKKAAVAEIHSLIKQATDEPYACIMSERIDFIEESKKHGNTEEYIRMLINDMNKRGEKQ